MNDNDRIKIMARLMKLNDYAMNELKKERVSLENYQKFFTCKKEVLEAKEKFIKYLEDSIKENERLIKMLEGERWPD